MRAATLICRAATLGRLRSLKLLVAAGADIDLVAWEVGSPPPTMDVASDSMTFAGANPDVATPFWHACARCCLWEQRRLTKSRWSSPEAIQQLETVAYMCSLTPQSLDSWGSTGISAAPVEHMSLTGSMTPLVYACQEGCVELVCLLCDARASLELQLPIRNDDTWRYDQSPLFMATTLGHSEVVSSLLQAGASIEARDTTSYQGNSEEDWSVGIGDYSVTALGAAAMHGEMGVLQILQSWGADTEAVVSGC